jgi:diguanylate cyclase (GGDEF)-like protein/PAS domain S-box-containing protein
MIFQMAGFLLSLLRDILPAMLSIVLSNMLIISGALLVLIGLQQFFNLRTKHTHNFIMLAVFFLVLVYFSLVDPNLTAREIAISTMIVILNGQSCYLLFRRVSAKFRTIAIFPGITLLAFAVVSFARIILLASVNDRPNEFFQSDLINSIVITIYLALCVLFAISLVLLVSGRLFSEIRIEKDKYNIAFNASPYAVLLTRMTDGKIFEVNEGFTAILGYEARDVIGRTTLELNLWANELDRATVIDKLEREHTVRGFEMQFLDKNGKIIIGLLSSSLVDVDNEKCVLTSVNDITEMAIMRQELEELATHDILTGLPNRKLLYDRFELAKANAQRENAKLAILSMDIDMLKAVNDKLGHDAGDQVLLTISKRLTELLRKGDTVSRFGGDEFVLIIGGVTQHEDIDNVVSNIQTNLAKPIDLAESSVNITVSLGIAIYPDHGDDIKDLLRKSDAAMYQVKKNGRNNHNYAIE